MCQIVGIFVIIPGNVKQLTKYLQFGFEHFNFLQKYFIYTIKIIKKRNFFQTNCLIVRG